MRKKKMKRKIGYLLSTMLLVLVFASQFLFVDASTSRINAYDDHDDGYLDMDCQVSIWAGPKTGGGHYMDHQYFTVDIDSETGCGIYWVRIIFQIQGNDPADFDEYVFISSYGLQPDWGPDSIYYGFEDFYEYYSSNMVVYAYLEVQVYWKQSGGSPVTTRHQY